MKTGQKIRVHLFKLQTISATTQSTASDFVIQTHFLPVASDPPSLPASSPVVRSSDIG